MKAAVLEGRGVIAYRDVPTPEPGHGEVLLRVRPPPCAGPTSTASSAATARTRSSSATRQRA
jgi:hypothetical protein